MLFFSFDKASLLRPVPRLAWLGTLLVFATSGVLFAIEASEQDSTVAPSYHKDVRPIFQAHCQGCHQPAKRGGEYVMTDFAQLMRGGESTEQAIAPGQPDESYLLSMITPSDGTAEMPKGKPPLSDVEIALIRRWIQAGATDDTPASAAPSYDRDHPPVYDAQPIVTSIDYSTDGKLLAVSGHHEVLIHHADGSGLAARLIGMSERIESIAFSPDGKSLAVSGGQPGRMGEIQVWDLAEMELRLSVPITYDTLFGTSWSPDSKLVAFGCTDNSVRAIDATSGEQVLLQRAPNDWTLDTVFSVDGTHLVSVGRDMAVKLIHVETERFIDNITSITPGALKGGLFAVARHPARDEVLVGGDDGVPRAFRMFRQTDRRIGDNSNLLREFPPIEGRIFDVRYHPSGKQIAAASSINGKGHVTVYSADYEIELPDDIKQIESKTVDQRNADEKKKLQEYRLQGVAVLATMSGQGSSCYALAYSPDGSELATAGFDGIVRIHRPETGELIREFPAAPLSETVGTDQAADAGETDAAPAMASAAPPAIEQEPLPEGTHIVALEVEPREATFRRSIDYVQCLVYATLNTGEVIDATRMVNASVDNPVVRVTPLGRVHPLSDGSATVTFERGELAVELTVHCDGVSAALDVDYVHDVMPAVSRMGCNAGTCHGAKDGKNGFKLSLRGYDPIADTRAFSDDLGARRINRASAASSLMLLKATSSVPHAGGQLTTVGSDYYRVIQSWIAGGVALNLKTPRVASIAIHPQNPVVSRETMKQQMRVLATYTDGVVRDVTREAFVSSGNGDVATVSADGLATALRRGEAPMLARFEGAYTATTMTVMGDRSGFVWNAPPTYNRIDELVDDKLQRTKTLPSGLCSDHEFVRRVYLDLTGLPPTLEQLNAFVNDTSDTRAKRDALVDQLIGSPAFVEHWTNKWADLLQVNRKFLGAESAKAYRDWIRGHIDTNTPYHEFAYQILTASGSNRENPAASYFKILRDPDAMMENTTHLFLATRFNCNKCHDHPFERWTQDQYYQLTAFFAQVGLDKDPESGDRRIGGTAVEGAKPLYEIVSDRSEGETVHDRTGEITAPQFPYECDTEAAPNDEPATRREQLARWITSVENPYFATSYVNRIWGYLLGTGLIEPIDDIRAGNPPSNPKLLQELTDGFIASGFDTRHLMRTICKSRTYQLSVSTNRWNEDDAINFSHAKARRLPAEVLFDAVHLVTGSSTHIPGLPAGTRAAELPDVGVGVPGNFLDQFGRPARESACECERSNDVLLGPVLAMINGPTIAGAIADPQNAITRLVEETTDDTKLVNELFLRVLNRPATDREVELALETIQGAAVDRTRLEKAHEDAERALAAYRATLPDKVAAWELTQYPPEWQTLDLSEFASSVGAALTKESDGSWTITGRNGKGTYEFLATTDLPQITGFRLEVLTDSRLPKSGPGRAGDGNFVLTEFRVTASSVNDPQQTHVLTLQDAQATFSQNDFDVAKAIDGKDDDRGWAIAPQMGKGHTALFATSEEVGYDGGTVLRFALNQNFNSGEHSIGRLRVAVTDSPTPHRLTSPPDKLLAAMRVPVAERTAEHHQVILDHYRATDAVLRELEQEEAATRDRVASQRLLGAQDIAWALINSPGFLFNH